MKDSRVSLQSKVFVAGHRGLIGSAVVEALKARGFSQVLTATRSQLDLMNGSAVREFLNSHKPEAVICCAAKVGGILANNTYRADFMYENLQIQNNLIWASHEAKVGKFVFLGSSCIYPKECPQPMKEEYLLTGPLEPTNQPYALAKIAGLELINGMRRQYGHDWFSVMPTNLFGPGDNYHLENSHVLPALVRKFVEAKRNESPEVRVWGTGRPKREFLYSKDCAEMIVDLILLPNLGKSFSERFSDKTSHINLGTGIDVSIAELASIISSAVGYSGKIVFDETKPDGTLRKLQDVSFATSLGVVAKSTFSKALAETVHDFQSTASPREV